jgi:hypothetical protein
MDSRLRVARGIAKNETLASVEVFQTLKRRGHPDGPPAIISDGWGGIDEAMIEVYGIVPEYGGCGRPPTRKKPGSKADVTALLGESTAHIERNNLASRLFNGRQVRKTLAFSKELEFHRAAARWEDGYYNLVRKHKSLRLPVQEARPQKWSPRTPAMAANLTDHIWTVKELLTTLPLPCAVNTR